MNIDTSNPGSTESALIHIRVPVSWYQENGLDPDTTAVNHCGDTSTEWETLDVVDSSNDEEYYYFTVRTPGFSEFSVAALPIEEAEESEEDTGDGADEAGADGTALEQAEDEGSSGFMWLIPVIAVILGLLIFVIRKKQNNE